MNLTRQIPEGFEALRMLREGGQQLVLHARSATGEVVLRVGSGSSRDLDQAELAVLAAVRIPGLARLVGFGRVEESGEPWVAREWVAGVELGEWAEDREAEQVAALVARLCPALHELHTRGFVHADLKPENIIVTPEGEPLITDFGLARRTDEAGLPSGTLFYVAPEVLLGRPARPASDLFALGVVLHALLIGERASAREFYSAFPEHSFFEASSTSPEDLPEWARGVVSQLLERDPARRPASALALAASLRIVIGEEPEAHLTNPSYHVLNWSPLDGREAFLEATFETPKLLRWLSFPDGDQLEQITEALRLWLTLHGEHTDSVDRVLLASNLEELTRHVFAEHRATLWLVPVCDEASRRALAYLARAALQQAARSNRGGEAPLVQLVAVACGPLDAPLDAFDCYELEPIRKAQLEHLLERDFEGDLEELVSELASVAQGSLARAKVALQRSLHAGDFVTGARGFLWKPGVRAELRVQEHDSAREFMAAEALLLGAIEVCGGEATLDELHDLAGLAEEDFAAAVTSLCAEGELRWQDSGDGARLILARVSELRAHQLVGLKRARAMYADRAEVTRGFERALCSLVAGPGERDLQAVHDAIASAQDDGDAPRALELAERFARIAEVYRPDLAVHALAEVALSWAALGVHDRAEATLEAFTEVDSPSVEAVVARVRGRLAHLRHDYAEAERCFERAIELESEDGGEVLFRLAMLLFDARKDAALAECLSSARRRWRSLADRYRWRLESIEALSAARRGELDEAATSLRTQLVDAVHVGDERREALVRNNLALIERRSGHLESAAEQLIRVVEIQERQGLLPGLAQSRAMLGATRREQGALHEAEVLLRSAFEIRERLGDASGALAVRGMLGLTYADAGRLRAAIDELDASVQALLRAGRSADAALLGAKLREVRARLEPIPAKAFAEEPASDPRVLLCHARAASLWDEPQRAREYVQRANDLATRLGLSALAEEVAGVGSLLEGRAPLAGDSRGAPRDEVALHLAATPDAFDVDAALECARDVGFRGRADLAARLAIAVVARAEERAHRDEARILARNWLSVVSSGLTSTQSERATLTLLGLPDPWPADLQGFERTETSDDTFDMDIITLLDINHRLVAQEDLPSLLGEIVESAMSVTRAERGFLVLEQDGELEFDTARHSRRGDLVEPESEVSRSILTKVLESGVTLRLSNATDDPLLGGAPSVAQLELRSILVAPFDIDDGLRGAIYVDHRLRQGAFSERAEQLLDLLAGQAALAIRQARRLHEIRQLNQQLSHKAVAREADLATARKALKDAGAVVPSSGLVGSSESMRRVHQLLERCAKANLAVLVCGPSGSGKELAARALHEHSPRSAGPFVSENCAALPASLIESELFGFVKGAFTGADRDRMGLFERADGGTLFLDEIGELPLELQAKLLRVIETGEIRRVGASKLRHVDFRLVAATNRDLHAESAEGRFRSDLVYRLDALRIEMPSLATRTEDIPELVEHFLGLEAARGGSSRRSISAEVMDALSRRAWPGNVRELANEVSRLCVLSEGDLDDASMVRSAPASAASANALSLDGEPCTLAALERRAIFATLEHTGGDKRRAAELLGISRAKIYQRLKDWASEDQSSEG